MKNAIISRITKILLGFIYSKNTCNLRNHTIGNGFNILLGNLK